MMLIVRVWLTRMGRSDLSPRLSDCKGARASHQPSPPAQPSLPARRSAALCHSQASLTMFSQPQCVQLQHRDANHSACVTSSCEE